MAASKIEWTDRSDWNPIRGCTRVSPGCGGPGPHGGCYAEAMAARFSDPGQWGHGYAERTKAGGRWTGKVEVQGDRVELPLNWRTPAKIFASSTSDWFHEALPLEAIATLYAVAVAAVHLRKHTFQILTKRSGRAREIMNGEAFWDQVNAEASAHVLERVDPLNRRRNDARATLDDYNPSNPPPGIWLGVSVEDQTRADERIPDLLETPAAIRFVSAEPLLGPIDFNAIDYRAYMNAATGGKLGEPHEYDPVMKWPLLTPFEHFLSGYSSPGLDWVICGAESGPRARPMELIWARDILAQCKAAGVAGFIKQLSGPGGRAVKDMALFPEDMRVREFPRAA